MMGTGDCLVLKKMVIMDRKRDKWMDRDVRIDKGMELTLRQR